MGVIEKKMKMMEGKRELACFSPSLLSQAPFVWENLPVYLLLHHEILFKEILEEVAAGDLKF